LTALVHGHADFTKVVVIVHLGVIHRCLGPGGL